MRVSVVLYNGVFHNGFLTYAAIQKPQWQIFPYTELKALLYDLSQNATFDALVLDEGSPDSLDTVRQQIAAIRNFSPALRIICAVYRVPTEGTVALYQAVGADTVVHLSQPQMLITNLSNLLNQ